MKIQIGSGQPEPFDNKSLPQKVLLHSCCAVCMAYPAELLRESGFEPVVWFYNPNIYPESEYLRRRDELIRYCEEKGYEYLIGDYEPEKWRLYVSGLENEPEKGARCEKCFEFRLDKAAQKAKELGIQCFTTTLTVSPHKVSRQVFAAGEAAAKKVSAAVSSESAIAAEKLSAAFKPASGTTAEKIPAAFLPDSAIAAEKLSATFTPVPDSASQDGVLALHRFNDKPGDGGYMKFLKMDFKKQDGFLKTMKLAKENNFYRQQYCGCEFSIRQ